MEKENVLEIEITKINDEWSAMTITKLDKTLENNDMVGWKGEKDTGFNFYERKIYINPFHPHQPFLILSQNIGLVEIIINEINEKYGIPKRFKPENCEEYYFILSDGYVISKLNYMTTEDKSRYDLGNCFETEEEAEKVKEELDKFWDKVRAGEIGG